MKARFDDIDLDLPDSAIDGIKAYLKGVAVAAVRADPARADCWTWGRAYVSDLCTSRGLDCRWGGDEDKPDDGLGSFAVVPASSEGSEQ